MQHSNPSGAGRIFGLFRKFTRPNSGRTYRIETMRGRLASHLQLNTVQEKHLDVVIDEVTGVARDIHGQREEMTSKLSDLLTDPRFDHDTAKAVVSGFTSTFETRMASAIMSFSSLYDELSEPQREALRELAQSRRWQAN